MPKNNNTNLYIIRHCEALGNVEGFFQGVTDCDITEKGKEQLTALKQRFNELDLDVIYSSPLKRAIATAEAVKGGKSSPIIKEPQIIEIDAGLMEGKTWEELPLLFPEEYYIWVNDVGNFKAPKGETVKEVYGRMKNAVNKIISDNRGKNIALVSHGCAVYMLMVYLSGYSENEITQNPFWHENAAVSLVKFEGLDLKPEVVLFNDTSHVISDPNAIPYAEARILKRELTGAKP